MIISDAKMKTKFTSRDGCRKNVVCRLIDEFNGFRGCDRTCCTGTYCLALEEAMDTGGVCIFDPA